MKPIIDYATEALKSLTARKGPVRMFWRGETIVLDDKVDFASVEEAKEMFAYYIRSMNQIYGWAGNNTLSVFGRTGMTPEEAATFKTQVIEAMVESVTYSR